MHCLNKEVSWYVLECCEWNVALISCQHAQMDEVKADMKHFDSKSLTDIKVIHDKTNRALTDARYWRTHANPTKLQEAESRYKQLSFELVDMVNSLVQNKETVYPEYMRKLGQAQLEFFERAVEAARLYMQKLYESMLDFCSCD